MKQRYTYNEISITRAQPEEVDALNAIAFQSKSYWGYPKKWLDVWRDQLEVSFTNQHHIYKAIDKTGKILGFYALARKGERLLLDGFWVIPEAMGKGVGRKLYSHMMLSAKDLQAQEVEWDSDPNTAEFYKRMGAKHIGDKITEIEGRRRILPLFRASLSS